MQRTYFSISEYHELTGIDRITIAKQLAIMPHHIGPKNGKYYWSPLALRILMDMKNKGALSDWTQMMVNQITSGEVKISPPHTGKQKSKP
jgi:hypothetical protein